MTQVSLEDYLEDIRENVAECTEPPILIGFSMGGLLCQKIAEEGICAGLVVIDTIISKEVNITAPYEKQVEDTLGAVMPAPDREEESVDESPEDVAFQKKYLAMESAKAFGRMECRIKGKEGISVDGSRIIGPCLTIKAVCGEREELQGRETAKQLNGEYLGLWNTSHTGLLLGRRYPEAVNRILEWLRQYWE